MHRIDETAYGYRITFDGFLERDAVGSLLDQMKRTVRPHAGGFSVLVDMRSSPAFPAESQEILKQAIAVCREAGMVKNAVVLNSAIATLQARRIAHETGIDDRTRYFDASSSSGWEQEAIGWMVDGLEPART